MSKIVATVYSVKRIENSYFGNPRFELSTSAGKLRTLADGSIGYSLDNDMKTFETQPKVEFSGGRYYINDYRFLTGDLLDDIAPGVRR